jgi:hypothetical protein
LDKILNRFSLILIFLLPFVLKGQQVVDEIIQIDTSFITYKVIYRETVGDYFQLKKAVFADDTSIVAIEKNYSNGHQNGLTRIYYPSGKLRIKAVYGNDKLQGEWTLYGEDGIIITKGVYNYGIKDGYWAYKSVKTFGRYKKSVKHRKWIKKDINNQKYKAFYWNGKKKSGSTIFEENYKTHADTLFATTTTDSLTVDSNHTDVTIEPCYILTMKHIAQNYYFRKASKDYFRKNKRERAKYIEKYVDLNKDVFKFNVAPVITPIDIAPFLITEKLSKSTIDSLLKTSGTSLHQEFLSCTFIPANGFSSYTTDKNSTIVLYLSKKINNLLVIDLVEFPTIETNFNYIENYKRTDTTSLRMLFLFNENNEIIEVEFQKKIW